MSDLRRTDANDMGMRGLGIAGFNRICRLAGLVIMLTATVMIDARTPLFGDFVQFHMAGLIDRAGAWDALYPVPIPSSIHNAGSLHDSLAKPRADEIAAAHAIDFVPYHFILPPPAALLFLPLSFFDGQTAHRLWLLVSVFAGWAAAMQAGMILQRCTGKQTRWAGVITLIIAAMPAMRRAVLVANLTPMISMTIGWVVLSLMDEDRDLEGAIAVVFGTLTKYATAVLMPIALVQRRWRMIGWSAALSIAWCGIAMMIMGRAPFIEFATTIAPTLGRSHEMADNISIAGVVLHALHVLPPLSDSISNCIAIARLLVLAAILLAMVGLGQKRMKEPAAVAAAAMALLSWLLVFSPVAWSHYLIYLCPLWGSLICSRGKRPWQLAIGWASISLVVFSPDQMPPPAFDPWGLHLLISLGMMLGLAMTELYRLLLVRVPQRALRAQKSAQWTGRLSDQSSVGIYPTTRLSRCTTSS